MKTKITFFATALLLSYIVKAQNVLTVDNSVGANAQYDDLQTAIAAATANDTIYVHPSEINYGNININKTLHLIGYSHLNPEKQTRVGDIILLDNSSNSTFSGLFIDDDFYSNSSTILSNIAVENCYIDRSIYFNNPVDNIIIRGNVILNIGSSSNSTVTNNYTNTIISNNVILGVTYLKNHQSITIKNNVFLGENASTNRIRNYGSDTGTITVQNNILYYNRSGSFSVDPNYVGVTFQNCLSYNVGSANLLTLDGGSSNFNSLDPRFIEDNDDAVFQAESDNYRLQSGSPAIDAGVTGVDIGLYDGGPFEFNNFGFTNGIPSVTITDITDRVAPGANLSVTISTNAN